MPNPDAVLQCKKDEDALLDCNADANANLSCLDRGLYTVQESETQSQGRFETQTEVCQNRGKSDLAVQVAMTKDDAL
jgi:hypothetical protein